MIYSDAIYIEAEQVNQLTVDCIHVCSNHVA